jgi:2-C-methyl-D-erythritol 4-phosphate cytidylyltransferase / 2-C-methyl-D-erythritol 2,4-cyclodiphosphate synthase
MKCSALIVAAGRGERAGGDRPKQYWRLLGRPVLAWSVAAFEAAGFDDIVIVIAPEAEAETKAATVGRRLRFVTGGPTRTASVRAGLAEASRDAEIVFVHDAARPGLGVATIQALRAAIEEGADGVAPALPVHDALWREQGEGSVDRNRLLRVQTPQAFRADVLSRAYAMIGDKTFADDIAVVANAGGRIAFVPGAEHLTKLTTRSDLDVLERLMSESRIICVGHGVDAHRFGEGDHVTLCGVQIAHERGLLGHSDADAGWHALVDAILGALGEGDIGAHFPPSDPQWQGADSERFLRRAGELAQTRGARIQHVDVTLICEQPKIGPHREAMRARTAEVLSLPLKRVSVKATTTERMGFTGREEGLAAQATATLSLSD